MLRKLTQFALGACLVLLVTAAAVPSPQEAQEGEKQAENQKAPKDQQEYELINAAFKETDPAKKIQLMDQWKAKYPETAYDLERIQLYMVSYQQTGQNGKAVEVAQELLTKDRGNFSALFTISSLTPFLNKTDAATLDAGVKTSKELMGGAIEKQFAAANKPAAMSQPDWDNARKQTEFSAIQTLGWVAWQKKENIEAENHFKKALELNPSAGQVSYWLGTVVLAQADPNKNELALFSFARAAVYDGPGSLPPAGREQVDEFLKKVYSKYAGTEEGLPELKAMAKNQPMPPADLKIESGEVRKFKEEQERRKQNPRLYAFIDIKTLLLGSGGAKTWGDLQGKLTPEFRLYVVSADPPDRPKTVNLSSKKGGPVEVELNLENRLRTGVSAGSLVTFEGIAESLSKNPFRLSLSSGKIL